MPSLCRTGIWQCKAAEADHKHIVDSSPWSDVLDECSDEQQIARIAIVNRGNFSADDAVPASDIVQRPDAGRARIVGNVHHGATITAGTQISSYGRVNDGGVTWKGLDT